MAQAPGHRFGQIIGDMLELAIRPPLINVARKRGLYLDWKHERPARHGRKLVKWIDSKGNEHDLDYVFEAGGSEDTQGRPKAFIEIAYRRYTKHSRNKAQEIQGAITPLAETYSEHHPFLGVVLAGVFTSGSLAQRGLRTPCGSAESQSVIDCPLVGPWTSFGCSVDARCAPGVRMLKILAFDIEISNVFELRPGEDINKYAPFDVAVVATQIDGGEHRLWFSPGSDDRPMLNLRCEDALAVLDYLDKKQHEGYAICAWNGLSFDLQWLGRAAQDLRTASRIARAIYDPLFQFFKLKGFPIGLEAVAKGMDIGLQKSMDAADAPRLWRTPDYTRVLEYVVGDVQMTCKIVSAIEKRQEIVWITRRGKRERVAVARLRPVEECMGDAMPDQSWMTSPIPQIQFTHWLVS